MKTPSFVAAARGVFQAGVFVGAVVFGVKRHLRQVSRFQRIQNCGITALNVKIKVQRLLDCPDVGNPARVPRFLPGGVQRHQNNGGEQGDNGNNDEKFYQSKSIF